MQLIKHLLKCQDLTPGSLNLRGKKAPIAANREKSLLSHIFTMAIRWGLTDKNPCQHVGRNKEIRRDRYVTNAEFKAVHSVASPMMQCIMNFAYLTGLRQSDILKLNNSNLTNDGVMLQINKTQNKILIEWTEALRKIINEAHNLVPCSTALFPNLKGLPYTPDGFRTVWQKLIKSAYETGLITERFRFHDIRRKTATDLEHSHNREQARKLLGHSDQKTTGIYISGVQRVRPLS